LTSRRRRLTARGVPPLGAVQQGVEWVSVAGAVAPTTGARVFLARPSLHVAHGQRVVDLCAPAFPDSVTRLWLEHRGAHTAQPRTIPAHVRRVFLPPSGPALTPSARAWRALQEALAWRQCPTLDVPQDDVATLLRGYEATTRQARAGSPSIMEAIHALHL
jgi:hypothetical protein